MAVEFFKASKLLFHDGVANEVIPSERYIAVELEIAGTQGDVGVSEAIKKWNGSVVSDGSIQAQGGGNAFEINTAPASGDKFIEQLKEITDALRASKAVVNDSCGYHVHVDARDFSFYDIRKLIMLYAKIEPALFQIVTATRIKSRYCHPCADKFMKDLANHRLPGDAKKKILQNTYGHKKVSLRELRGQKYNDARYSAMNIHSWAFRGTIECRMHHGTSNFAKITNWAILWASILDTAKELNEKEILSITGEPIKVLLEVAPTQAVRDWIVERFTKFQGSSPINSEND